MRFLLDRGASGIGLGSRCGSDLKGGSTIGIPSPPAIWEPGSYRLFTPDLRDPEKLQGFEADWTRSADEQTGRRRTDRWRLVGNAVSVPVAQWLGSRLQTNEDFNHGNDIEFPQGRWPTAAWGRPGERKRVCVSMWPVSWKRPHLLDFLRFRGAPLSERATAGFLSRAERGKLRISEDFLFEAHQHLRAMRPQESLIAA